jgi:N-acetylglucosamine kinase-like BadF-type ATPase
MAKILGIDAGGSKTRVICCDMEDLQRDISIGTREELLRSGNFRQLGKAGIRVLIREIITRFQIEDPDMTFVLGGFAGAGTQETRCEIESTFEEEGFQKINVTIMHDAGLILRGLGDDGIVLIAGTGSICFGRRALSNQGNSIEARAGGYGYQVLSEVGGYNLGMRAIDAVRKMVDGRKQEPTVLCQRFEDYFGLEELQQIASILHPAVEEKAEASKKIADLSKIVLQAAHEGDHVAKGLVDRAVNEYADHIQAVYDRLGSKVTKVGLHGGLFANPYGDELLIGPLQRHPVLVGLDLKFETIGIREGDRDGLIEAVINTFGRK